MLFTMDVCRLLSLEEANLTTDTQAHLLRLLVPVLKLFTAKKVNNFNSFNDIYNNINCKFHGYPISNIQ